MDCFFLVEGTNPASGDTETFQTARSFEGSAYASLCGRLAEVFEKTARAVVAATANDGKERNSGAAGRGTGTGRATSSASLVASDSLVVPNPITNDERTPTDESGEGEPGVREAGGDNGNNGHNDTEAAWSLAMKQELLGDDGDGGAAGLLPILPAMGTATRCWRSTPLRLGCCARHRTRHARSSRLPTRRRL